MCPERFVTHVSGMFIQNSGCRSRTRTYDPLINSQLLYRLSYAAVGPLILPSGIIGRVQPTRKSALVTGNAPSIRRFLPTSGSYGKTRLAKNAVCPSLS